MCFTPKYLDGNENFEVDPGFFNELVKYGTAWVKKDVRSDFYPRCEADGEVYMDPNGVQLTKRFYYHVWADFYDAERRLANETRQNLANKCKEKRFFGLIFRIV